MKAKLRIVLLLWGLAGLLGLTGCVPNISEGERLAAGKHIAFDRAKGNCLACHLIAGGEEPGNIGKPLVAISAHYKNKQQLRAHLWDQTQFNALTSMPPFGRNKILTEAEIDQVVDYLWSL